MCNPGTFTVTLALTKNPPQERVYTRYSAVVTPKSDSLLTYLLTCSTTYLFVCLYQHIKGKKTASHCKYM